MQRSGLGALTFFVFLFCCLFFITSRAVGGHAVGTEGDAEWVECDRQQGCHRRFAGPQV